MEGCVWGGGWWWGSGGHRGIWKLKCRVPTGREQRSSHRGYVALYLWEVWQECSSGVHGRGGDNDLSIPICLGPISTGPSVAPRLASCGLEPSGDRHCQCPQGLGDMERLGAQLSELFRGPSCGRDVKDAQRFGGCVGPCLHSTGPASPSSVCRLHPSLRLLPGSGMGWGLCLEESESKKQEWVEYGEERLGWGGGDQV